MEFQRTISMMGVIPAMMRMQMTLSAFITMDTSISKAVTLSMKRDGKLMMFIHLRLIKNWARLISIDKENWRQIQQNYQHLQQILNSLKPVLFSFRSQLTFLLILLKF